MHKEGYKNYSMFVNTDFIICISDLYYDIHILHMVALWYHYLCCKIYQLTLLYLGMLLLFFSFCNSCAVFCISYICSSTCCMLSHVIVTYYPQSVANDVGCTESECSLYAADYECSLYAADYECSLYAADYEHQKNSIGRHAMHFRITYCMYDSPQLKVDSWLLM